MPMNVYIISNEAFDGWLKVGKANNVIRRMKHLQTAAPTPYVVEFVVEGLRYDRDSHDILTKQGIVRSGEWFKCDLSTARTAVLEAKAEQDRVDAMVEMNRLKAANDGWLAPREGLASAGSGAGN